MLDWEELQKINADSILKGEKQISQEQLQLLYDRLKVETLDAHDENVSKEDLIHLFKLTQIVMQAKNNNVVELEEDLEEKDRMLRDQDIELRHRKFSPASGSNFEQQLQAEIIEMEKKCDQVQNELEMAEVSLESERLNVASLQMSIKEEKARSKALEESSRRLEASLRETKMLISTQKGRLQNRTGDEEAHRNIINQKNAELMKYVEEIQILSTENNQMATELEEITYELEASLAEIEKNADEIETLRQAVQESEQHNVQLVDERDSLRIRVEDLSEKTENKTQEHENIVADLKKTASKLKSKIKALELENEKQNFEVQYFKDTSMEMLKEKTDGSNGTDWKRETHLKDEIISDLKSRLEDATSDFMILANDWNRFDTAFTEKAAADAPKTDTSRSNLKEKISMFKARRTEDTEKIKALVNQVTDKEQTILALEHRIMEFETGAFGLKDAILEIKQLKSLLKKEKEKGEISILKLNDLEAMGSELAEENFFLRENASLPPTDFDISSFKATKAVELEKVKSLNFTLNGEIEKLEEERLSLKSQLRLRALERGEKAIELGIDSVDMYAVEEYAEALRSGEYTHPAMRPVLHNSVINKLLLQLEIFHQDMNVQKERMLQTEKKLACSQNECNMLESAVLEISKSFIEAGGNNAMLQNTNIELLITSLNAKYLNNPQVARALNSMLDSKHEKKVKNEVASLRSECEQLKRDIQSSLASVEKKNEAITKLQLELAMTRNKKSIMDLNNRPSEELLSNSIGFPIILEQLIECLGELEEKSSYLSESKAAIQEYTHKFLPLAVKVRLLYREFVSSKTLWHKEVETAKDDLDNALAENAMLQTSITGLEDTIDSLAKSDVSKKFAEVKRKLIVLEVNEMTLKRRIVALETANSHTQQEKQELKSKLAEMDSTSRKTISRLYRHTKDAKQCAEVIGRKYADSVPLPMYKILENKLAMYISKTKILLEKSRNYIEFNTENKNFGLIAKNLQKRLDEKELELKEYEHKAEEFDKMIEASKNLEKSNNYSADVFWRPKYANMVVKNEVLENRAKLAEEKVGTEVKFEEKMREQLENMEKLYIDAKDETIRTQEENLVTLNQYQGGATKEEFDSVTLEIEDLKLANQKLKADCVQFKTLSDISTFQNSTILAQQEEQKKEMELLKSALRDLQMVDDTKLVMGQLHQHIMFLQKKESAASKYAKEIKDKCSRLEQSLIEIEGENSQLFKNVFDVRISAKNRVENLQMLLSSFRNRFCGSVLLEKHERTCLSAARLFELNSQMEKNMEQLSKENEKLRTELDLKSLKASTYDTLVRDLSSQTGAMIERRIVQWHGKMLQSQSQQLKAQREALNEREIKNSLLNANINCSKRSEELEDMLLDLQKEHDIKLMEWQSQTYKYEQTISRFEEERDRVYLTTSALEIKEILPDRMLPIGQQLEEAVRILIEKARQNKILIAKANRSEEELIHHKKLLSDTKKMLDDSKFQILQLQLAQREPSNDRSEEDEETKEAVRDKTERDREAKALRFAHETTMTLQRQLEQKNEMIHKYREMLQHYRNDLLSHSTGKDAIIADLNDKIQDITAREIDRVTTRNLEKREGRSGESNDDCLVQELENLLVSKEMQVQGLQAEIEANNSNHQKALDEKIQQLEDMNIALKDGGKTEMDFKERIKKLEDELQMYHSQISRYGSVKDLSEVVRRLQAEDAVKSGKISSLKKQIEKLKTQLVDSAMAATSDKSNVLNVAANDLENELNRMSIKIQGLEAKNNKVQQEKFELEKDVERLSELIKSVETRHSSSQAEFKKGQIQVHQLLKLKTQLGETVNTHVKEIETLKSNNVQLKESLSRSEKDRLKLSRKIVSLSAVKKEEKSEPTKVIKVESRQSADEVHILKMKVMKLQSLLHQSKAPPLLPEKELKEETNTIKADGAEKELLKKLEQENQKLSLKAQKDAKVLASIKSRNNDLSIQNETLVKDIVTLRKLTTEKSKSDPTLVINKMEMDLADVKKQVIEKESLIQVLLASPENNDNTRIVSENRRLKRDLDLTLLRLAKLS